jgi:hypothetical protein
MKKLLLFLVATAASCMVWAAPDFPAQDFPTADFPNNPPRAPKDRPVRLEKSALKAEEKSAKYALKKLIT